MNTTAASVVGGSVAPAADYAPSWVDALIAWIERLPGPAWIAYLAGAGIGASLTFVESVPSTTVLVAAAVYYGALPFAVLLLIRLLDRRAGRALRSLRPILEMDDGEAVTTAHRLTVVPARPAIVLLVAAIVLGPLSYVVDPVGSGVAGLTAGSLALRFVWESFVSALFLVLIYHTFRQLRLIDAIHRRIVRIDLFDQAPLYSFSRVTSLTATGLVVLLVPGVLLIPSDAGQGFLLLSAAWYAAAVAIAAAAFVLPLRGIHDRIDAEKRDLQAEIGRRITTTLRDIHVAVDAGDGQAVEARQRALATLRDERELVNKVPTWPWSAGALTGFISAVLLPIGLWIVTRALERLV